MELEKEFTFRNTSLPQCSYNAFVDMRNQKKFCDIELNIGTQHTSAHRVILAAGMPLFREIFSNEGEILVPNIDPAVFELLIDYVYSCELKITMNNVRDLLSGSCILQMNDVQDACCEFLLQRLQPENVLSVRDLANHLNLPKLKNYADLYVKEHFEEVSRTEEFLNCPFEYLRELIGKDDLNVGSEEKVLDSVLRWVKASAKERKTNLEQILGQVRMVLFTPLYLTELVEREELIRMSLICRDLVDEAKNYNLFEERRKKCCSFITEPRQFMNISEGTQENDTNLYCLIAKLKHTVQQYHLINETWQTKCINKFMIHYGCIAECNSKIYFFDGIHSLGYDPEDDEYKWLGPFAVWRNFAAAVTLRNKIFVCGGCTSRFVASNAVECYDPEKDEVKQVHALQKARWALNAVSLGNYIYALGGMDNYNVYDIVEKYSFVLDKWIYVSPLLTPRYSAGASVLNHKIYICGGCIDSLGHCTDAAEMYDPLTNKWQFISCMNTARAKLNLLAFSGKLYALCGCDDDEELLESGEVYDLESDTWNHDPTFDDFGEVSGAIVL